MLALMKEHEATASHGRTDFRKGDATVEPNASAACTLSSLTGLHCLAERSGDCVRLGSILELSFVVPSYRDRLCVDSPRRFGTSCVCLTCDRLWGFINQDYVRAFHYCQ